LVGKCLGKFVLANGEKLTYSINFSKVAWLNHLFNPANILSSVQKFAPLVKMTPDSLNSFEEF
jgi:hypothetical protein